MRPQSQLSSVKTAAFHIPVHRLVHRIVYIALQRMAVLNVMYILFT